MMDDINSQFRDSTDKKVLLLPLFYYQYSLKKIFLNYLYYPFLLKIIITLDPDPNWAKILYPDPNSMYLDPQHWIYMYGDLLVMRMVVSTNLSTQLPRQLSSRPVQQRRGSQSFYALLRIGDVDPDPHYGRPPRSGSLRQKSLKICQSVSLIKNIFFFFTIIRSGTIP